MSFCIVFAGFHEVNAAGTPSVAFLLLHEMAGTTSWRPKLWSLEELWRNPERGTFKW